jgi:Big-like domain-containing protein
MKKLTNYLSLLAVAGLLSAGVSTANAAPALKGFSPIDAKDAFGTTIPGLPAWYQDINGVAVKPCLDPARCALAGTFNPVVSAQPRFPDNFPEEFFYFAADADPVVPGASSVLVVNALEIVFVNPLTGALVPANTLGAVALPFQRLRLVHTFIGGGGTITPAPPANGNFTVRTPWGTAVFTLAEAKCVNQGGDTKCSMTRDFPAAPNPAAALGDPVAIPGSISTFLRDPTAPAGFIGVGAGVIAFTGAPAGGQNSFTVTDPLGRTGTTTQLSLLLGQTVGLEIAAPGGITNFGVAKPAPGTVAKTFNLNNLSGVAFTPVIVANVPASNPVTASPDFTIAPSATLPCPTGIATLAIGANCNFDVVFSPTTADGAKSADISVTGVGVPPAQITVTGTADSVAPVLALTTINRFSKTATQTISGSITDANGVPAAGGVKVSVDGAAPVNATVTGTTWTFPVPALTEAAAAAVTPISHTIAVTATDNAQPLPGNAATPVNSTIVVDTIPPVITLAAPVAGTTKIKTPNLIYAATDTNAVTPLLRVDGTLVNPTPSSGVTLGPLADGPHTVQLEAIDAAGNTATKQVALTVDTIVSPFTLTAPAATHLKALAINGTVEAGSTVTVAVGTGAATAATVTGTNWNFPIPTLVDGVNNITVNATDTIGNTGTKLATITVVPADGKITGAATVVLGDALKALQFATGLVKATPVESVHADVAPLVNGVPAPNGKVDTGDVVVILRKAVGLGNF